jgi:hyperosmotically inducible protein
MRSVMRFVCAGVLVVSGSFAQAPDNSKINKRDDNKAAVTPEEQSNKKEDIELTRKIRRELTKSETLSTYAKNVKIITSGGMTTLRGPVKSQQEKDAVEAIAKRLAGDGKVTSHLEIAPEK